MVNREQHRDRQQTEILDAARAVFSERPFDDVRMAEIAQRAGVARATVFNHFESKRGLIDAITAGVLRHYESMLIEAIADVDHSTAALLRRLFVDMGIGIAPDRAFYRSVFRELARFELGIDEGTDGHETANRCRDALAALIRRGIDRNEFTEQFSPESCAAAFTHLANGTIHEWLWADDDDKDLVGRLNNTADLFLRALGRELR